MVPSDISGTGNAFGPKYPGAILLGIERSEMSREVWAARVVAADMEIMIISSLFIVVKYRNFRLKGDEYGGKSEEII